MKIFLLEDDEAISMGLSYSLEKEGYEVTRVATFQKAQETWTADYDLAILDINLPDGNGYDICKMIKQNGDTPVIFLTAVDAEVNVVMGLELGADDYICKPFRVNELLARVKTVLRRAGRSAGKTGANVSDEDVLCIENLKVYTKEAKVTRLSEGTEKTVELTALEYRLLLTFYNNRGVVLSRNKLLSDMWDISGDFINDSTLTVYIKRLRDKIEEDPADPKIIRTVRGMGYILPK